MSSFFVAGTDTNVGKTTVARAMIQALQGQGVQVVGYKPIACCGEESIYPVAQSENTSDYDNFVNADVLTLMNSTKKMCLIRILIAILLVTVHQCSHKIKCGLN